MGWAKVKGNLKSRIGKPVRFGAPKDVRRAGGAARVGRIIDEVWADEDLNKSSKRDSNVPGDWGDYSFFAQRIKWDHGGYSIRIGYYRRRAGEDFWEFAGQMTICARWQTIMRLVDGLAAKQAWFCDAVVQMAS